MKKVIVVGAGLVGSLQAILLAKRGFQVEIIERRGDIRKADFIGGRSINLALSHRGWKAIALTGIEDKIREIAIPMKGRMIHDKEGYQSLQPYGKEGQAIYSISRGELNRQLMLEASRFDSVHFTFNKRCIDIDLENTKATFIDEQTGKEYHASADAIYGTDGAFSAVRGRMQKTDRFNFSQEYLAHGYKELVIPANEDGSHKLDKNALHIWPRGQFMLIALANLDGSFTVTLFFPFEGETSFDSLDSWEKASAFFDEYFADAVALMPNLKHDFYDNPTSSLVTVRCFPWHYKDSTLLMGDASHAIVPFYGQGMNAGFEDCYEWWHLMERFGNDTSKVFPQFSKERKPNGDAIADLALQNYIEMRDLVANPNFVLQKKIEKKLHELYPDKWIPLYSMVTFSDLSYSEALNKGKMQDSIMHEVLQLPNIEERWNTDEVLQHILSKLN